MTLRVSRLGNGFTIVSRTLPDVETAAVGLNADVGARHESAAENGLAHLFEHMVFKGTATRSARAIAEAIEDVGGSLNAWTSRDATVFHARVLGADMPLAVTLIADLVRGARFDAGDLEREREVVLSEIGEARDTPDDLVFDHVQMTAFPGQALGRPILGTEESLAGLDAAALRGWRDRQYRGGGLVLSAAGRVDHDALVAQAEKLFDDLPAGGPVAPEAARWAGGWQGDDNRTEQVHIALGHEAPCTLAPDYFAAQIFTVALGGGMSSRLFQEVREERGLAYSVSASHGGWADSGMLSLYLATQPRDAGAALDLTRKVASATVTGLEPVEVERARAQLKAGLLMGLEGCAGQADWLGRVWLTHGRIVPVAEVVAALDAVTVDAAQAAGAAMLASPAALAAVGPRAGKLQ